MRSHFYLDKMKISLDGDDGQNLFFKIQSSQNWDPYYWKITVDPNWRVALMKSDFLDKSPT